MTRRIPLEDRFWPKVDRAGDCWLWTGALDRNGYGRIRVDDAARAALAHRIAYELAGGSLIDGREVDHKPTCPKRCVNPAHLRLVTRKQNQENRSGPTCANKSGVRGVCWHQGNQLWVVQVQHGGERHCGGYFKNLDDAAEAARKLRLKLFTHNDMDRVD